MFKTYFLIMLLLFSGIHASIQVTQSSAQVPQYQVFELSLKSQVSLPTPFNVPVTAKFISPKGNTTTIHGFYDGDNVWKIRFMPNKSGTWSVEWLLNGQTGKSSFVCSAPTNPKIHGHIYIDPKHPRKLHYEDGVPLFWHGGKYLNIMRPFGTDDLEETSYPERLPTWEYITYCGNYFENISAMGLNGAVFKVQVLPLLYNLEEMNLEFFQAMDEIVSAAMENGINLQVNLFDTWGKRKEGVDWALPTPENCDWLLLEPWDEDSYRVETEFYLQYLINRYAAFPNILWELWNEAEKLKTSAAPATQFYRDFFRSNDPYQLLIGASEMYTAPYQLDVVHAHLKYKCWPDQWDFMQWAVKNDKRFSPYYFEYDKPYIWNEIGPWDNDANHDFSIEERNSWFRAMFWSALTLGSAGISEDHWSDIRSVPDGITTYHSYFAHFTSNLVDLNSLEPSNQLTVSGANGWECRNESREIVTYLYTQQDDSKCSFETSLGAGSFFYQFFDPKTGSWISSRQLIEITKSNRYRFYTPQFDQDIVFYLASADWVSSGTPVEWGNIEAHVDAQTVRLSWTTCSESNNLGFEIYRSTDHQLPSRVGFIKGQGTTAESHHYVFNDSPPHAGLFVYRINQLDTDGTSSWREIEVTCAQPMNALGRVTPNPAHGLTHFSFPVQGEGKVEIVIYNSLGQVVKKETAFASPPEITFRWDGDLPAGLRAPSGLYFYRLYSPNSPHQTVIQGKFFLIF